MRLTRHGERIHTEQLTAVAFVPLVGEHGYSLRSYPDDE
jgi:hypothetical protein